MPTNLRRITITLPPEVDEAVTAMAEAEGIPHAKVVSRVLADFAPTMLAMAKVVKQAKLGQMAEAKRTMQHAYGDQLAELLSMQLEIPGTPKRKGRK